MTDDGASMLVPVDCDFYRVVFGEEPSTKEEEHMSPWERARRRSRAFVRQCMSVTEWRGRERRTASRICLASAARESRRASLPAPSISALVDVFRILQAWDNETRR